MSEKAIQEAIQKMLQGMAIFGTSDVVINDWDVLDNPNSDAPYAIIQSADEFEVLYRVQTPEATWSVIVNLVERFDGWHDTLNRFRDDRQAILNLIADTAGEVGLSVRAVRSITGIEPVYDVYLPDEQRLEAEPIFLMQALQFVCEEF